MPTPLIVVEADDPEPAVIAAGFRNAGWDLVDGFETGATGAICVGRVASAADASAAVAAALRGAGVVVAARAPRDILDRLCDDLRHLGPVEHLLRAGVDSRPVLPPELGDVLTALGEGLSIPQVAERLGVSRRTVDRRLAAAREALGVTTSVEAVVRWGREAM